MALYSHGREFVRILGMVGAIIVYAGSRPERRRLLGALQTWGATSPDNAMTEYQLGAERSRVMSRLLRQGLVATTADGRFYLADLEGVERSRRVSWLLTAGATVLAFFAMTGLTWLATRL